MFIKGMTLVNVAFGMIMLLAWRPLASLLQDPVMKLLGGEVAIDSTIFNYPFVVLWMLPFTAVAGTVMARSLDAHRQAKYMALFPAVLIACSCVWLYVLSDTYA
jgi:hypothetical protein